MAFNSTVSFIVVNWNGGAQLAECLDSIAAQTLDDYEVIVVDNGSTDGSCDLPHFQQDSWRLVKFEANVGFSKANNEAFRLCSGEFLALVNNDVVLTPTWGERMIAALGQGGAVGSAACRILQKNNAELLDSAGFRYFSCGTVSSWGGHAKDLFVHGPHDPFGAVASAAMYRVSAIETTGLFHDEYFCYYEDTDLALRLVLHGFGTAYANDAVAYHHGSFTGGKRSDLHIFHLRRNIEYLYWVDMVGSLAWRYLLPHMIYECLAFFGAVLTGQTLVVLKAKLDFLRHFTWVVRQRKDLRIRLRHSRRLKIAKDVLRRRMSHWIAGLTRAENTSKLCRPTLSV